MKGGNAPVMVICRGCAQTLVEPLTMYIVELPRWEFFKFEAEMILRPPRHTGCNNPRPMLLVDGQPLRDSTP